MIKTIAFDVDGVILDSVHENFVVCQKVMEKRGEKLHDSLEGDFRKGRCFLRSSSKSMFSIAKLTMQHANFDDLTQDEFERFADKHSNESTRFSEEFFATRKKLQSDYKDWFSLNSVFPGVKHAVDELSKKFRIAVMSTKDYYSISSIFETAGISIDKKNIFSKEVSESKAEQMKAVCEKLSCSAAEIFFIDDQVKHLEEVKKLGASVALAGWGYNNPRQKEEALRLGIPVVKSPEGIEGAVKKTDER